MPWMDWMAHNHSVFVHVPVAVAILIPLALLSAQRAGRGIRPWWVTCRYLAWGGVIFSVAALLSGLLLAKQLNFLAPGQFLAPKGSGDAAIFRLHQALGASSFVLGILTLKAVFRRREEHQGLGFLALFLGLLWATAMLGAGWYGGQLGQPSAPVAPVPVKLEVQTAPVVTVDPEIKAPLRALDYLSLVPMHSEPVRNPLHGNRWIRVWASPGTEEAYRAGNKLPEGSLLVMSSAEDRWGRPGFDPGPLYALEMKDGKPRFSYYWPQVPVSKRGETGGAERVYWRGEDPSLAKCLNCHSNGLALKRDRSSWTVPKKPKVEVPPTNG
jgi:uncharacterized membrane protein